MDTPSPTPQLVFQRAFVGRIAQLEELRAAFKRAAAGHGSLAMIVGEPGIGKTALCEQIASEVADQALTLTGHCYEEGALSLPYLPFVEAMRTHVHTAEADALLEQLGPAAGYVARIVPDVCSRLAVKLAPQGDPEEDRLRLLQAVVDFLRNVAAAHPLLLILEDLHDADKGTLDLLGHLARNLSGARLLVVGTYRDVEVGRAHPLSAALAGLRRVSAFERVALRGLTLQEVHGLLNAMTGQEVRTTLAEAVYRQTEGNPLFVQEVLRYLADAGYVARRDGRWRRTGEGPPEAFIPEGLKDVIGQRLSRLSEQCNRALAVAAVIGREFRLDVLQQVSGMANEEVFHALEEAARSAIIEQRSSIGTGAVFRFAHALFRQTLYEEMFVPRRIRLHQQVGRALEQVYSRALEEHAAEMADHFAQSTEEQDLEKALRYSEMAAERSMEVYAYSEAARLLEQTLQVQDVLDPADKAKRCDLLLALAEALMPAGDPDRVVKEVAPQAFDLARAMGDRRRAVRTCRLALEAHHRYGPVFVWRSASWHQWAERANEYAEPGSIDRVYADLALGRVRVAEDHLAEGVVLFRRALDLARELDDEEALFAAAWLTIMHLWSPEHWSEGRRLADEFSLRSGARARTLTQALVKQIAGLTLISDGERAKGEALLRQIEELGQRSRDAFTALLWPSYQLILATLDGRLEEATGPLRDQMLRVVEEAGGPEIGRNIVANRTLTAWRYLGEAEQTKRTVAEVAMAHQAPEALAAAYNGRMAEAVEALRRFVSVLEAGTLVRFHDLTAYLHTAVLLGEREAAESIVSRLSPLAHVTHVTSMIDGSVGRVLGEASVMLGRPEQARAFYQQALEGGLRVRFRPGVALIHLRLAELLLDHYPDEREEAAGHLAFAIPELREMKMQPSLDKALALQDQLGASAAKAASQPLNGLSDREVEVLCLLATGKTDREISEVLFIAVRTVGNHVSNILAKTGAANRTEAASYAARRGLL